MKIAIAGGTGFIGRHLVDFFVTHGDDVVLITRQKAAGEHSFVTEWTWQEVEQNPSLLEGVEALINLAGETISQRWTEKAKQRILQSRLDMTKRIADLVSRLQQKPRVVVNSSAVGIYGMSERDVFTEQSETHADDFLAQVVQQWERAAEQIQGTRLVLLRTGLVLGRRGGAFPKMVLPYRLGVGGPIGSGRQFVSWIQMEDLVRLIDFCIRDEKIQGPVNATAPQPVTNEQFGRVLGQVVRKPHWLRLPGFVLKLALGEMADLLLKGQHVQPEKALQAGFVFQYPSLESALRKTLAL